MLVEFASAVNAVKCAVELQHGMARRIGAAEDRRIVLRIGINLGDVMVEGGDLYGDGVNIAARLEGIAEPGGILVSGSAYEQVRNKIETSFEDLGSRSLKNIGESVRVYRSTGLGGKRPMTATCAGRSPTNHRSLYCHSEHERGSGTGIFHRRRHRGHHHRIIAVSVDLFVIARNSSFGYRDKAVEITRVGRELGVRYVLEGSIQRSSEPRESYRTTHRWHDQSPSVG